MPPSPLVIKQWRSELSAGQGTVRADVGGIEVWFRAPDAFPLAASGDPWLAVGLLPAMALGATLDLRDLPPLSPKLLAALPTIQDIWTQWNPQIHRIEVLANSGPAAAPNAERMCFFSGGVDATFSALARAESLTRLVFVNGFDFAMSPGSWAAALARVESLGTKLGIPVLGVETNWIELTRHHRISRGMSHGGCLMGVAHLLAPAEMIVAASNSYARLAPWGTQPVLDPLWSTEATAITHHGASATRAEKVEVVARHPGLLGELWVCHEAAERNCGDCVKCRRTRATLALVGVDSLAFPDAKGDPIRRYAQVIANGLEQVYLPEIIALAQRVGRHDAVKTLTRAGLRLRLRLLLREADDVFLGGRLSGFKRRHEAPADLRSHGLGPLPER
jgi:7-cyano-7-deazaguanine synthase in queuosine biosynthesis